MLKLVNLQAHAPNKLLLRNINLSVSPGEMVAVIGPSGCGKSTLLKAIVGLGYRMDGQIFWHHAEIGHGNDFSLMDLAYVPQFGIFYEDLTVQEILTDAVILRLGSLSSATISQHVSHAVKLTGMEALLKHKAKILSGGQRRRLALSIELVSNPAILLADEVTSGLDPKSEEDISLLLRQLTSDGQRIVITVTHGLNHLHLYDKVIVLNEGTLIFDGTPDQALEYFNTPSPEALFKRLEEKNPPEWEELWNNRVPINSLPDFDSGLPRPSTVNRVNPLKWIAQFYCLARRRLRLFFRNKGQIYLHLFLLLVFPALVVLFALKGLPAIHNMTLEMQTNLVSLLKETLDYTLQVSRIGALVSSLAMFQIILLSLMGANNTAREIAAEREIFEKEKLSEVSISAYLGSKFVFMGLLVLAQSFWMTFFVKSICHFPGEFGQQFIILGLINLSLATISLAISAWSKTAEQASLVALYLVGFQLPLSGAVLALPDWLASAVRPLIAAYWGWSGYLDTLKQSRFYDIATAINHTPLEPWIICISVLCLQIFVGLIATYLGCYRSSLNNS